MKNSTTIPVNGTKDEINLKRLLSSMNDREIQEIYTHVRIKNLSEDFLCFATDMLGAGVISRTDYDFIKENIEALAIHFMDTHDLNIPDCELINSIIGSFLDDMHNHPVMLVACYNHKLYIRSFKNLIEAQQAMRQKIEIIMASKGIKLDTSMVSYASINYGWDSMSGWLYYDGDNYDWKIVYESDIPSNS